MWAFVAYFFSKEFLKALPAIFKMAGELIKYFHGQQLKARIKEIHDANMLMKDAKTDEERQAAARKIAEIWAKGNI